MRMIWYIIRYIFRLDKRIKYDHIWFRKNAHNFDRWFNPSTFKFSIDSNTLLIQYCSKDFDKWYNPDFGNSYNYQLMYLYCEDHFDKWFTITNIDCVKLVPYIKSRFIKWVKEHINIEDQLGCINRNLDTNPIFLTNRIEGDPPCII